MVEGFMVNAQSFDYNLSFFMKLIFIDDFCALLPIGFPIP